MNEFRNKFVIENEKLFKLVYADFQVSFYKAGIKALGINSKMITTPLLALLESKDISIGEMTQHYLQLSMYLADVSQNVTRFMQGEFSSFTTIYYMITRIPC